MNPHLSDDALEFGAVAAKAFADAGGVELARRAEADPTLRASQIRPLLDQLGAADLDVAGDPESAEAAAALCRATGAAAVPYPVVPLLLGALAVDSRPDARRHPTPTTPGSRARVDHADLFDTWRVASVDGTAASGSGATELLGTRLGPFVGDVEIDGPARVEPIEIALHLTLTAFVVNGALAHAVELATAHVVDRVQFDKPLSSFQAVQFQLADAHVATAGAEECAQFALWRCHDDPDEAIVDALAARLAAVDASRGVLRITQQLHGAAGVCDEYDISVMARHLQPALRLPFGAETTALELAIAVEQLGFPGLFAHGGDA